VPLPAFLVVELRALHKLAAEAGPAAPDRLVFATAFGSPLRRSNFRRQVWGPALLRAGLVGLRFHDYADTAVMPMCSLEALWRNANAFG
jgi:hypothetical protein